MEFQIDDQGWNETTEDKLAEHGLSLNDAFDVLEDAPNFFRQRGQVLEMRGESVRARPSRLRMMGSTRPANCVGLSLNTPMNSASPKSSRDIQRILKTARDIGKREDEDDEHTEL